MKHIQKQIEKDIEYFNEGLTNPHWYFEHNPNVAKEMQPLIKQLEDEGISWSW